VEPQLILLPSTDPAIKAARRTICGISLEWGMMTGSQHHKPSHITVTGYYQKFIKFRTCPVRIVQPSLTSHISGTL
jgi:hypothetical protein